MRSPIRPPLSQRLAILLALGAGIALLVACRGPILADQPVPPELRGGWHLVAASHNDATLALPAIPRITLFVETHEFSGSAVCNQYGGRIGVDGSQIRIAQISQNDEDCAPGVASLEASYLSALQAIDQLELNEPDLFLLGPNVRLHFQRLADVNLEGLLDIPWQLDSALSPPATLTIHSDGSLTASTGCRSFSATWIARGDEIVLPGSSADGDTEACSAALLAQEREVLSVLGDSFRVHVDNGLTVTSRSGASLVYRHATEGSTTP